MGTVLGAIGSVVGIASGVSNLVGGDTSGQGNVANGAYYDPFANYRDSYAKRLNDLMSGNTKDVSAMVMGSPGYMPGLLEGQRTLQAGLARTGQVESGAEKVALNNLGTDYFKKSYNDLYNQYTTLSGATQQPLSMSSANQLQQQSNQAGWGAIAQGVGSLANIYNSGSTSAPTSSWVPNNYSSGYAPDASSGYSGYQPIDTSIGPNWSDRRLKTNIKLIGKYKNGINKYSWTYLWGVDATGAMADEVEKLIPEAVTEHFGFKAVNYALLGE
jgi:hypothetical protein